MTDVPVVPPAAVGAPVASPVRKAVAALLLPLFFVVVFPLMFVSALHKPSPHDLPLLVVGPTAVVAPIAEGLDVTAEFSVSQTDVVSEASSRVADRTVDGAIEVTVVPAADPAAAPTFEVTTYVANAEGRSVAAAVQSAGASVATQLGTTSTVTDVAPLAATDELGTTLFYLLTYTSLGAYLVIIVLTQVLPGAGLRVRYLASTIAAIVAPLIVYGLSSIWVGDYERSFGTIAALLGVNALYVFTVGAAAILIQQFLGRAATFGIMAFVVFLNFPSAGGAGSEAMLPPFWQFVHNFYFGAGAYESFRSITYFDGHGTGRWLLQLSIWTVGLILATIVVHLTKTTRQQKKELAVLRSAATVDTLEEPEPTAEHRRHAKVETVVLDTPDADIPTRERHALTTGEGTSR